MRFIKRAVVVIMTVAIVLSSVGTLPVFADNSTGSGEGSSAYTKKVVSVLFDNSASMQNENRFEYAMYAMQALLALLGPDDTLIVTPMNTPGKNNSKVFLQICWRVRIICLDWNMSKL